MGWAKGLGKMKFKEEMDKGNNFVDNFDYLEDLYKNFNTLIDNIDFNKYNNTPSSLSKELGNIKSKINKIEEYINECLVRGTIHEESVFFSLQKVDDLLVDIYILPQSFNFPIKDRVSFENNYQFREKLDNLINKLSNEINLISIYASKYAVIYLNSERLALKAKLKSYGSNIYLFQKNIEEINSKLSINEDEINKIGKIESDINNKLIKFNNDIDKTNKEITEEINHEQVRFINNLTEHSNKLKENLDNLSNRISNDVEENVKKQLSDTKEELDAIKEQSKDYKIRFEKLYELMKGMYGVAGDGKLADYNNKQANVEKASADKLRKDGIRWLSLPIIVTLGFVLHYIITGVELNIEWIITRFLTVSISASLAIYMLKESASHRSKENLYRQRGTQLATIGAYISDFPDEQEKMKLKTSLVNNFYSFHNGKADTSNVPDLNAQIKEIVTISKSLSKIIPTQHQDKSVTITKEDKPQPTPSTRTLEKEQKETK
ncbi:hypothetical protein [Aliivibrio fischeri]|uniref:hypothetical protein n=1 Tax=Aliivibrio fischeri TaxID=668 RepID=UPI000907E438|nr:hypothetical protein [Aliivibrio fischeri]